MEERNGVVDDGKELLKKATENIAETAIKFEAFSQRNPDDKRATLMSKIALSLAKCFRNLQKTFGKITNEL